MSKRENEKGLASGKRRLAFFLRVGFEATVDKIPHLVIELVEIQRPTSPPSPRLSGGGVSLSKPGGCEHLRAETHESIHVTQQNEGGCTMELVRGGAQYRENPHFWALH